MELVKAVRTDDWNTKKSLGSGKVKKRTECESTCLYRRGPFLTIKVCLNIPIPESADGTDTLATFFSMSIKRMKVMINIQHVSYQSHRFV